MNFLWGAIFCGFFIFAYAEMEEGAGDGDIDDDSSDQDGFFSRIRRQTESAEQPKRLANNRHTQCVVKNLKEIEEKLEKSLPPEKNASRAAALAKPHQLFSNADTATLEKFCTIYKSSRTKLAACGESQAKTFATKGLAVVDFICIERYEDFIKAFACIQKVDQQLDATCRSNCSEYESAAEKLNKAGAAVVTKYGKAEIKELFAQSCLYVSCFMDCQGPTLESTCGADVLALEKSSIGVTFRNLDEMMSQSAASNVWPNECKPLSAMGGDAVHGSTTHQPKVTQAADAGVVTLPPLAGASNHTESSATTIVLSLQNSTQATAASLNSNSSTSTSTTQAQTVSTAAAHVAQNITTTIVPIATLTHSNNGTKPSP